MSKTTNGFRNSRVLQSRGSKKDSAQTQSFNTESTILTQGRKAARKKSNSKNTNEVPTRRAQQPRPTELASKPKSLSRQKKVESEAKAPKRNPFSGNTTAVSKKSKRPINSGQARQNRAKSSSLTTLKFKKISIG